MANEGATQALMLLPLLLMACDVWTAFTVPPASRHRPQPEPELQPAPQQFSGGSEDTASLGGKFHISYCTSCSYKNTAAQVKNTLESSFPGTIVVLSNYPPPTYKQVLSKFVPVVQFGGMGLVFAGEHIFPMLGYAAPPAWYNSLRQNRFGTVATCWLLGNALQSFLVGTGAFEVYYDGNLVFSKLQTKRFPSEMEIRALLAKVLEKKDSELLKTPLTM